MSEPTSSSSGNKRNADKAAHVSPNKQKRTQEATAETLILTQPAPRRTVEGMFMDMENTVNNVALAMEALEQRMNVKDRLELLSQRDEQKRSEANATSAAGSAPPPTVYCCPNADCKLTPSASARFCQEHGALVAVVPTMATTSKNPTLSIAPSINFAFCLIPQCVTEQVKKAAMSGEFVSLDKFLPKNANSAALKANSAFNDDEKRFAAIFHVAEHNKQIELLEKLPARLGCAPALLLATPLEIYTAFTLGLTPLAVLGNPARYEDYMLFSQQFMALFANNVSVASVVQYIEAVRMAMQGVGSDFANHKLAAYNRTGTHPDIWTQVSVNHGWNFDTVRTTSSSNKNASASNNSSSSNANSRPTGNTTSNSAAPNKATPKRAPKQFRLSEKDCFNYGHEKECAMTPCPFKHEGNHTADAIAEAAKPVK